MLAFYRTRTSEKGEKKKEAGGGGGGMGNSTTTQEGINSWSGAKNGNENNFVNIKSFDFIFYSGDV